VFLFSSTFNGIEQTVTFSGERSKTAASNKIDSALAASGFNIGIIFPYVTEVSVIPSEDYQKQHFITRVEMNLF
jgi:hypothetical protein